MYGRRELQVVLWDPADLQAAELHPAVFTSGGTTASAYLHLVDVYLADVHTQILQVSCKITAPPLCGFCRYRSAFSSMFCTIPRISSFHRSTNHWGAKGFAFFPWDRTHSKTGRYWEEVKDIRVTSFSSQSVIS